MKTLYLECTMGAAGDMLAAALLELAGNKDEFITRVNSLGIPGVSVEACTSVKCGITGTHYSVTVGGAEEESVDVHEHDHDQDHADVHDHGHGHGHAHDHHHDHYHCGMDEISRIIGHLPVSERVKNDALAVYRIIAEAEADAHGRPAGEVHFHEVGSMDAVADIVSVCMLMEALAPKRVIVSPVHVGSGMVRCAHGTLPVPAPATARILRGIPIYGGMIRGELCTPTGAAILKHFADEFGGMPVMNVEDIGYGMGKKDFEAANCVRAFYGESGTEGTEGTNGEIAELSCNLDDMTGEALGFASEILFANGALDVFTIPVMMKKSRPGYLLTCVCRVSDSDRIAALMLKHTTTFGVRRKLCERYTLERSTKTLKTPLGEVRVKEGHGYGITKSKPEYEDAAQLAREHDLPLSDVIK